MSELKRHGEKKARERESERESGEKRTCVSVEKMLLPGNSEEIETSIFPSAGED